MSSRRLTPEAVTRAAAALAIVCSAPVASGQAIPRNESCVSCHLGLDDERLSRPAREFEEDIHAARGFGCLDCHGPNVQGPERTPEARTGFLSAPDHRFVSRLCGRCHSDARFMRDYNPSLRVDQEAEYATSRHGTLLASRNDPNVAVCVSCHPAHSIKPSSDPQSTVHPLNVATTCGSCHANERLMAQYGIPTDQRAEYEQSTHWRWMSEEGDVSAPTCNDCHGNHGAAPPGVGSVRNVCGQCHSVMADYFSGSEHDRYFTEANLPGCATCHGNHEISTPDDGMLLTLNGAVCAECHDEGTVGGIAFPAMKTLIDSLLTSLGRSQAILAEAANVGMEVSQAQFNLEEVNTAVVKARAAVHAFVVDSLREEIEAGRSTAAGAHDRGQAALDEHLFRRQGLAVSVVLIVLFIVGLTLKIRQLERDAAHELGSTPQRKDEG